MVCSEWMRLINGKQANNKQSYWVISLMKLAYQDRP